MAAPNIPDPEILEAADDGRMVDLAMYRGLLSRHLAKNAGPALTVVKDPGAIDDVAREQAEDQVAEVGQRIAEAESALNWLAGVFDDDSLGMAAINATGIKLGEVREQLPALRQAVRDLDLEQAS